MFDISSALLLQKLTTKWNLLKNKDIWTAIISSTLVYHRYCSEDRVLFMWPESAKRENEYHYTFDIKLRVKGRCDPEKSVSMTKKTTKPHQTALNLLLF